jgi:retron-type reverse transcriptase
MNHKKAKKIFTGSYDTIISMENLLLAWREFRRGKGKKTDVQNFEYTLIENLSLLHVQLKNGIYQHGAYQAFKINDPKPRDIHKACVTDRVLHHALYRVLSVFFFPLFIADSYSCQLRKGTHRALNRFAAFSRIVSENNTKQCFVLKCDIKKFFASIDQVVLIEILQARISDKAILKLLQNVIESFDSGTYGKGLPLDNLTSQLLVNIYMNEFDHYVKQTLKVKHYIRYADDFVILSHDRNELTENLQSIGGFLRDVLQLELHPQKVSINTFASGVDFLGWVHFPTHRVLRTSTKRRVISRYSKINKSSYQGLLSHGDAYGLSQSLFL